VDFFEMYEDVVMSRFPEGTPCTMDVFFNIVEEVKMGW